MDPEQNFELLEAAIGRLHRSVGSPSSRVIAEGTVYSHTTVANLLRGRVKTWNVLESVVLYLGGDPADFVEYFPPSAEYLNRNAPDPLMLLNEVRTTNSLLRELIALLSSPAGER